MCNFEYVISNLQVLIKLTALCFSYGVQTIPFLFLTSSKNIPCYWYRYQVESQAPTKNFRFQNSFMASQMHNNILNLGLNFKP